MVLSAYERRVAAEIEAELRMRDASWSRRVDALVAELAGRGLVRRMLPIACLLGGVALLLAGRQVWLSLELAIVSGVSASSIRFAFAVAAYAATLTALVLFGRAAYDRHRRRYPRRDVEPRDDDHLQRRR